MCRGRSRSRLEGIDNLFRESFVGNQFFRSRSDSDCQWNESFLDFTGAALLQIVVTISSGSAVLSPGQTAQFRASVTGISNTAVRSSDSGCGTISSSGLYTAPSRISAPSQVSIIATSVANPPRNDSAEIYLVPQSAVVVSPAGVNLSPAVQPSFTLR